jgi:GTP-binding protein HflX
MTSDHLRRSRRRLTATVTDLEVEVQRAFLIGVLTPDRTTVDAERGLDELALLTATSGSDPIDEEIVRRREIDPATFIGSGKAKELASLTTALDIDVVVFDNELTPAQQRNLQKIFQCDVVDREAVILDIFAQHATSKVGSLQVELAMHHYNLPRLRGKGQALSQQGFGVLARGPGETKLETDRRRILERMSRIERDLKAASKHRATQRKSRKRQSIPQVAIVGYTNAGKSTLLNALTDADVLVKDQLFATLDPTVRRLALPDNRIALLADTVGFVRQLPHHLVEAFQSTLAEVTEADLLLHVVDATDPDPAGQMNAVRQVLSEIHAIHIPEVVAFNKVDLVDDAVRERIRNLYPDASLISAASGIGLGDLLAVIADHLERQTVSLTIGVPYERGDIVAAAHRLGQVLAEKHDNDGTILEVRVPLQAAPRFAEFSL